MLLRLFGSFTEAFPALLWTFCMTPNNSHPGFSGSIQVLTTAPHRDTTDGRVSLSVDSYLTALLC